MTIYDIFFLVFAIGYLPYLALKSKAHEDFGQRFGFLPESLKRAGSKRPIWIHAVSVGEVMACRNLVSMLCERHPEKKIVLSTTTKTGQDIARKILPEKVEKFYFPLDFGFAVRKALDAVRPSAVAVMETEIWPNFIIGLSKRKIPVFIINGRLSERSSRGYKRIKFVFKNILRMIEAFSMQSEADSRRIKDIGAPAERVTVTGNMKFDVTPPEAAFKKEDLGLGQENFLIFGASTHKGEEKILTELYARLKKDFPGLRLLIAPRHVDRSREIAGMIREMDLSVSFISELKREKAKNEIFILDTMGELLKFLSAADLVFMGGSLVKRGGHNLVEPALFGKAMLFGPNMFNFRRMRDIFLEEKAALEVKDGEGLTAAAKELISDEAKRRALGEAARAIIEKNKGATERNLDMLSRVFKI